MSSMLPPNRPRAVRSIIDALAADHMGAALPAAYALGCRAYYRDTMGIPGRNDRSLYDDAIFVVGPHQFGGFNANTDPSVYRSGIATLVPGVHLYHPGNHGITRPGGGYPAFRPATPDEALPVTRDGQRGMSDGIAINIHRGGYTTTSSAGCQTIHPEQWDEFYSLMMAALRDAGQKEFPYILIEGPII